jgi:hypothetical protein
MQLCCMAAFSFSSTMLPFARQPLSLTPRAGELVARHCDISSSEGCGVIGMNSRLHSIPEFQTKTHDCFPLNQHQCCGLALVLDRDGRLVCVYMCASVFEHCRFMDTTSLLNFFGALLPDRTSATVAVSAQQGCKMQASGQILVVSGLFCDDLQINACHLSPASGCGLHTCDQAECTMVNSR